MNMTITSYILMTKAIQSYKDSFLSRRSLVSFLTVTAGQDISPVMLRPISLLQNSFLAGAVKEEEEGRRRRSRRRRRRR